MALESLNGNAEFCLKTLNLPKNDFQYVKYCIIHYTEPKVFFNYLQYAAFRVWNAIKSLFGYSAWQQSLEIIRKTLINKGNAIVNASAQHIPKIKLLIMKYMPDTANEFAGELLEYCLLSNDLKINNKSNERENPMERFEKLLLELRTIKA